MNIRTLKISKKNHIIFVFRNRFKNVFQSQVMIISHKCNMNHLGTKE